MKISFILAFLTTFSISLFAQDCGTYYPFKEGTSFELTSYDKKDKVEGVLSYKVLAVSGSGNDQTATINFEMFDEKGEKVEMGEEVKSDQTFNVRCSDGNTYIDMESLMFANPVMSAYENMEISMEGEKIILPNQLSVGENLPDASLRMTVNSGPVNMNMTMNFLNRKVETQEQLTTPAGTFDTFVISYDSEFKMGITRNSSGKQWIAEGVGIVKEEFYNKGGKLLSYTELTALNQ